MATAPTMCQPKLNRDIADEIRRRAAAGERHSDLAREFGVTATAIYSVVRGTLYSDRPRRPAAARPRRDPGRGSRRRATAADRILALLQSRSVARSVLELAETLGVHKETVSAALKSLRGRGLVVKVGTGSNTRYRVSGVAPVAQAAPSLRGDRPRLLGLGAAWRRQHPPDSEPIDEPGPAEATA